MLLDHMASPAPGLNADVVDGVIEVRIGHAYVTLISAITTICRDTTGTTVPIVIHGYDRPVPDGRGFLFKPLPGPWLRPGFERKGFSDIDATTAMMGALIDQFNRMLRDVARLARFEHVRYVDLRGTLPNGPTYRTWWDNELHPTARGFSAVALRFANVI